MDKETIQDAIIPLLSSFLSVQLVESGQAGDVPDGPHVVFTATLPYGKDVGRPDRSYVSGPDTLDKKQDEDFITVWSFTSIHDSRASSISLAQQTRDWFSFYGEDFLSELDIAVVNITGMSNRDSVNEYEYRNGFDVTLRAHRQITASVGYFDKINYNLTIE